MASNKQKVDVIWSQIESKQTLCAFSQYKTRTLRAFEYLYPPSSSQAAGRQENTSTMKANLKTNFTIGS